MYIEHGNGYETRYAHLDNWMVNEQTYVATGQLIGYMGTTGHTSCTPHVHFEILNNNVNPKWLNVNSQMTGIPVATVANPASGYFTAQSPIGFSGTWKARTNYPGGTTKTFSFGLPGDIPMTGDWNSDGFDTPGVVRYNWSSGALDWHLSNTKLTTAASGSTLPVGQLTSWGVSGDTPISGNWDGVGGDSIGAVRRQSGSLTWFLPTANPSLFSYGLASDNPLAGNWDCSGGDTPGITRSSQTGVGPPGDGVLWWHLDNQFGTAIDYTPFAWGFTYGNQHDRGTSVQWDTSANSACSRPTVIRNGAVEWHLTLGVGPPGVLHSMSATANDFGIPTDWDYDVYDDYMVVS